MPETFRFNELFILKVLCYATTSVSQKLFDFFSQHKNTIKRSSTELPSHFCVAKKNVVLKPNFDTKKLWTDSDSSPGF